MTIQRMTPKEIARSSDQEQADWLASEADPRKIQELLHLSSRNSNPTLFEWSKIAVSILVSERQAQSARTLERFTFWLIVLTVVLIAVSVLALVSPFFEVLCHIHQ